MVTTDPRDLIADGRKYDEAMTPGPWTQGQAGPCNVVHFDGDDIDGVATVGSGTNRRGIAWIRNNLRALLDGYAAALDDNERLRSQAKRIDEGERRVLADHDELTAEVERLRERIHYLETACRSGVIALRTYNAESATAADLERAASGPTTKVES